MATLSPLVCQSQSFPQVTTAASQPAPSSSRVAQSSLRPSLLLLLLSHERRWLLAIFSSYFPHLDAHCPRQQQQQQHQYQQRQRDVSPDLFHQPRLQLLLLLLVVVVVVVSSCRLQFPVQGITSSHFACPRVAPVEVLSRPVPLILARCGWLCCECDQRYPKLVLQQQPVTCCRFYIPRLLRSSCHAACLHGPTAEPQFISVKFFFARIQTQPAASQPE